MSQPLRIVLVEDDDIDTEAVRRVLRKSGMEYPMVRAKDGADALELLRREPPAASSPCLVLLDINLPRMNGFEFLEALRGDAALRGSTVMIVTTSDREEDKTRAAGLGVVEYVLKKELWMLPQVVSWYC